MPGHALDSPSPAASKLPISLEPDGLHGSRHEPALGDTAFGALRLGSCPTDPAIGTRTEARCSRIVAVRRRDEGALELRRLSTDEWELWRAVRLRALAEAPYAFASTLSYWQGEGDREERWRRRLADVPLNVVALNNRTPIGQVSGTSPDQPGWCELISMWVDPAARGRGVGEALIHQVLEWATSLEASAVALSVKEGNAHAIALYERASVTRSGEPGDDPSEIRMQRLLR